MRRAKAKIREKIRHWLSQPVLVGAALVLGAIVGMLTAFFGQVLQRVGDIRDANPLYWIPALALGGIAIVLTYKKIGKGSERGMGIVFDVAHGNEREIPLRLIPLIMVTTWVTHLFGGSSGREGVAMQIGATLGHNISSKIPVDNAPRILLVAGMAAGFAGLFQTPMAAIALSIEILLAGHLEMAALLPAAVAAVTAYKVSEMLGYEKFSIDLNAFSPDWNIASLFYGDAGLDIYFVLKLAVLGLLFGIVGGGFARLLPLSKKFFAEKIPNPVKRVAIMGVCLSLLLIACWQGRYSGLGTNLTDMIFAGSAQDAASSIYAWDWILKMLFTIVTLSVGFQGGEVTPLFTIGATFGAVIASLVGVPFALAAGLGYAAVFGGATNTLFAPILVGAEIFGFDTLPAFFIVCTVAYVCNGGKSIYAQKKIRLR
ncbi:MAG: chloride channel protein [Fibrobacter sp.]|nr:chloride channel protein [Fibrobacter sp.]